MPGNPLSVSSLGYDVDYGKVNQVNVFDQGRISYLNREIVKNTPKLEDNLQILRLRVRKPRVD